MGGSVLVTGASGLLGTWLRRTAPPGREVWTTSHHTVLDGPRHLRADLREPVQVRDLLRHSAPEVIVHAAYRKDRASIVDATDNLVEAATALGTTPRFLHVSSEAVFSGDGRPRAETDQPDPIWDYGRWKAAAERAVLDAPLDASVIRLPLLVSVDPPDGIVSAIRSAVQQGGTVGWYAGERRPAAYAADVAAALWRLVGLPAEEAAGPWHLPGPERLTRVELGSRAARVLGVSDPGVEVPAPPPDRRPHDLWLLDDRARRHLAWDPRRVHAAAPAPREPSA